jgi:hypothetical protein
MTSAVGRNELCPCGSGLKFKKCCLNKTAAITPSYSSADREQALLKLMRFATGAEFKKEYRLAFELFWGDWLSEAPDEELKDVMASETVSLAYNSWFAFDFDLGDGRTVFDLFCAREDKRLSAGERNFLQGMRGSHLRLYEILEVRVDEGFEVRDLWDDRRLWVRERSATRQIVAWDLVVARIGPSGDGAMVFETVPYLFPAAAKNDLVRGLRKAHRVFTRQFPTKSIADFFKAMAPVFHKLWLEQVALPPRPKIMTGDGEPFIFAKVIFDLLDRDKVASRLVGRDDIVDQGDGTYVWLESVGELQRSLGTIVLEDGRIVLETTSQKRAEKARDWLPSLLGDAVRFRAISYEDIDQALKRGPAQSAKTISEIPPDVKAEVLGKLYEEHYRKWLDEPVPALGNRTPRHAARLITVRPKLIALLKDLESRSERQRRAGEPAYDPGWMWKELNISRE